MATRQEVKRQIRNSHKWLRYSCQRILNMAEVDGMVFPQVAPTACAMRIEYNISPQGEEHKSPEYMDRRVRDKIFDKIAWETLIEMGIIKPAK